MTEQTPLERLEYEMRCIGLGDVPDSPMFERVRSAAIAYIKHAEARIKELVDALHEVKEREATEIVRANVAEAKLKAWEDAPRVEVCWNSNTFQHPVLDVRALHDGRLSVGTYHLKPAEANDEVV